METTINNRVWKINSIDNSTNPATVVISSNNDVRTFTISFEPVINPLNVIQERQAQVIAQIPREVFDVEKCKSELFSAFGSKLIQYAPYYGVMSDLIEYRNFAGLSQYINGLLQSGIIIQEDHIAILQVFNRQQISLA